MRTMLISKILIFICSLTQFVISDGSERPTIPVAEKCGGKGLFTCIVPSMCVNSHTKKVEESSPYTLDSWQEVFDDCPALIRFHLSDKTKVYVSIASFKDDVKSIEFVAMLQGKQMAKFACIKNTTTNIAESIFFLRDNEKKPKVAENVVPIKFAKLQCTFEVKTNKKIFITESEIARLIYSFKIDNVSTDEMEDSVINPKCNLAQLKFDKDLTSNVSDYKESSYKLGKYFCNDTELYHLEYKREKLAEYKNLTSEITCSLKNKLKIGNEEIADDEEVGIRCVADVKYFCNYNLKGVNGKQKAILTPPIPGSNPSEMKCPQEFPHLVIKQTPIRKYEIECINHFGTMSWTLKVENDEQFNGQQLTKNGPEVYCTNKLECRTLAKISDSALDKGYLDKEGLPKCYLNGTLYAEGGEVTKKWCNDKIGQFMYTVGNTNRTVDANTKFRCDYPVEIDEKKEAEVKMLLVVFSGVGIALTVVLVSVVLFFVIRRTRKVMEERKIKMEKEALERVRRDESEFKQFCYTSVEREKMKKEKLEKKEKGELVPEEDAPISARSGDQSLWSPLIMHFCSIAEDWSSVMQALKNLTHVAVQTPITTDAALTERVLNTEKREVFVNEKQMNPLIQPDSRQPFLQKKITESRITYKNYFYK